MRIRRALSERPERLPDTTPFRLFFLRHCCFLLFIVLGISCTVAAQPVSAPAEQATLEVFVRDGCPHCADAKAFLPRFAAARPWLRIVYRLIDSDASARDDLARHSQNADVWPPGVPTFVCNGRVLVGFESDERAGPLLAELVAPSAPASAPAREIPQTIDTNLLGGLGVSHLGLPLFTLFIGLLDGFNPCAMWVLLILLAMLVHLHERQRMALIAGTFVLVSGAVYYAFMAAWLNFFLLLGMSAALRILLGTLAYLIGALNIGDFLSRPQGLSLSIPESAKPGIHARMRAAARGDTVLPALLAVVVLAVVVNAFELLCTAGLPAMYTAILAQQNLTPWAHYAYLGLYIVGYIADDALMVAAAVITLSSRKLSERAGRWLKLISGAVMLALGSVLLFRPEWLS